MLIGLLSDPHANIFALESVLEDVESVKPDALVCLGDFVGYGSNPNEVIAALADRCSVSLAGNHDACVLGDPIVPISRMNSVAAAAIRWTADNLTVASIEFLGSLRSSVTFQDMLLVHASPRSPVLEYVINLSIANENFAQVDFGFAFVGHTHIPAAYWMADAGTEGGQFFVDHDEYSTTLVAPSRRAIFNPGGVGQPRDGDPRASWATFETSSNEFTLRRVEYPVEKAQAAILAAGLPEFLADRLAAGF